MATYDNASLMCSYLLLALHFEEKNTEKVVEISLKSIQIHFN